METIHFSHLHSLAERGPLQRGLRYIQCHVKVGDQSVDDYATEVLTLTPTVTRSSHQMRGFTHEYAHEPHPVSLLRRHSSLRNVGYWDDWAYASDMGQWDVPGVSYQNIANYMLDVNALLRQGIIVGVNAPLRQGIIVGGVRR